MNKIKVASWNVNSIRARIDVLLNWLKITDPDILLLQEVKAREQDFPFSAFEQQTPLSQGLVKLLKPKGYIIVQ